MTRLTNFFDGFTEAEDALYEADQRARGEWEKRFVSDLADKFHAWGMDMFLSQAQFEVLDRIVNRKGTRGRS